MVYTRQLGFPGQFSSVIFGFEPLLEVSDEINIILLLYFIFLKIIREFRIQTKNYGFYY
jgi:hypothetical protein